MMNSLLIFSFSMLVLSHGHAKEVLTLEKVLESCLTNFPLVKAAIQDKEMQNAYIHAKEGAFDTKLKVKYDERYHGYYDAQKIKAIIEKPLRSLNSRLYAGYTHSDGDLPVYEQKEETLSSGEYRLGLALSLLRNRSIDENRFELELSKLKLKDYEFEYLNQLVDVRMQATKAYWKWVTSGKILSVYKELLETAKSRQNALIKKVRKGDEAKIYLTENSQYILQRENLLIEAKQEFNISTFKLSLFMRDDSGNPLLIKDDFLPSITEGINPLPYNILKKDLDTAIRYSPKISKIKNKIKQNNLKQELAQNQLLPTLDLNIEGSRDYGSGPKRLEQTEQRAYLNFVFPFERRKSKGMLNAAKAENLSLKFNLNYQQDLLSLKLQEYFTKVNTSFQKIRNLDQEIVLAKKLTKAENIKLSRGASDFFMVNQREQNYAKANISKLKEYFQFQEAMATYQAYNYNYLINL